MRRLSYTSAATRDLDELFRYSTMQTGSADRARALTNNIRKQCRKLARLPVTLGRPRPDVLEGMRSFPFGEHIIIFFRDIDDSVRVIHSHRDLPRHFDQTED